MASHSSMLIAIGFDTVACLPLFTARMMCSACRWFGVATHTASTFGLLHISSAEVKGSTSYCFANASTASLRTSQAAVTRTWELREKPSSRFDAPEPRPMSPQRRDDSCAIRLLLLSG